MLKTTDILTGKGLELVQAVIASQAQKGLRDTGYSANNTRFEVSVVNDTDATLSIIGPKTWLWQERGRGPNRSRKPSRRMVAALKEWATRHGMDESAGYPIAAKIARDGIEVPNPHNPGGVLSDVLDKGRIAKEISQQLTPLLAQEVRALLFA